HFEIAAGARSGDSRVFFQHGRDAKRVPDAVAVVRVLAHLYRESCRNGGEWRNPPDLAVFLEHDGVRFGKAGKGGFCFRRRELQAFSHLRDGGSAVVLHEVAVDKEAQVFGHGRSSVSKSRAGLGYVPMANLPASRRAHNSGGSALRRTELSFDELNLKGNGDLVAY